jgi:hypothetical protein
MPACFSLENHLEQANSLRFSLVDYYPMTTAVPFLLVAGFSEKRRGSPEPFFTYARKNENSSETKFSPSSSPSKPEECKTSAPPAQLKTSAQLQQRVKCKQSKDSPIIL